METFLNPSNPLDKAFLTVLIAQSEIISMLTKVVDSDTFSVAIHDGLIEADRVIQNDELMVKYGLTCFNYFASYFGYEKYADPDDEDEDIDEEDDEEDEDDDDEYENDEDEDDEE